MLYYLSRKTFILFLTLVIASVLIFSILDLLPGDPAAFMLGMGASEETLQALRAEMGLNQSSIVRYFDWIFGMLRIDFGTSIAYGLPVADLIWERCRVSLPLAGYAMLITIVGALAMGLISTIRRGSPWEWLVNTITVFGIAIPSYWLGLMLIWFFSITLGWFDSGGFDGWENGFTQGIAALTLPAFALAFTQMSILTRVFQGAMNETEKQDFVRTAKAKGLNSRQVIFRHMVRNSLVPVLTILGLQLSFLVAGTVIIENIFYLPGLGRLMLQAVNQRDLILVRGCVMSLVVFVTTVNFIVDLAYAWIDPRVRTAN